MNPNSHSSRAKPDVDCSLQPDVVCTKLISTVATEIGDPVPGTDTFDTDDDIPSVSR